MKTFKQMIPCTRIDATRKSLARMHVCNEEKIQNKKKINFYICILEYKLISLLQKTILKYFFLVLRNKL